MKQIFFSLRLIFCVVFCATNAFSQGYTGLIGRWSFNGNANDVSGNGLNGVVYGATLTTGYSGLPNTAYYFDGTSNYITIPYNSLMNSKLHSICALIEPLSFNSGPCQGNYILCRGQENLSDFYGFEYDDNTYDNDCSIYSPGNELFIGGTGAPISTGPTSEMLYTPYTDSNTWYCVVLTYDGDSTRIYVNGVLKSTDYRTSTYVASIDSITIGKSIFGSPFDYFINANVDEIRLYNRVLSDSEVMMFCDSAETIYTTNCDSIIGILTICAGSTTTLSDLLGGGGSWSSGNTAIATIDGSTGLLTGISVGTATITYTTSGGDCTVTNTVSVDATPSISGPDSVCVGSTITLSDGGGLYGTWTSSATDIATVGSTGMVTGISAGVASISYINTCGNSIYSVTVLPIPVISGPTSVCVGNTISLSDGGAIDGTWSSSNAHVARIGSTGIVTGLAAGTSTITYVNMCGSATETVTVDAHPVITGISIICEGETTTVSTNVSGGTWSSSNTAIATVSYGSPTTGLIYGVSGGTASITYTTPGGCFIAISISVTPEPEACVLATVSGGIPTFVFTGTSGVTVYFSEENPGYTIIGYGNVTLIGGSANVLLSSLTFGTKRICIDSMEINTCIWPGCNCPSGSLYCCASFNPLGYRESSENVKQQSANNEQMYFTIIPNPNDGIFIIKGTIPVYDATEEAKIEVTDMLGKVVYSDVAILQNGIMNKAIVFPKRVANGVYFIKVRNNYVSQVMQFTLDR